MPKEIYSKTINIIQGSGTGKSRLMAALSCEEMSVCFTFRKNCESGYPPGDREIRKFLLDGPAGERSNKTTVMQLHTCVLAVLSAVFETLTEELTTWPPDVSSARVAGDLADRMAPARADEPLSDEKDLSDTYSHTRSRFKKEVCARVCALASAKARELQPDLSWRSHFNVSLDDWPELEKLSAVVGLKEAAHTLCHKLRSRPQSDQALVVLVFDGARMLIERGTKCDMYIAMRRLLGTVKKLLVWTFFLSTNVSAVTLGQPRCEERSGRIAGTLLAHIRPYHALPLDLGVAERFYSRHPGADDAIFIMAIDMLRHEGRVDDAHKPFEPVYLLDFFKYLGS